MLWCAFQLPPAEDPAMWISGTPTDLRQGLTRRDWLRVGLAGGLASLLGRPVAGQAPARAAGFGRARSCILIYLFGGVSQLDVWDLKPDAPDGIRGEFRPRATSVGGVQDRKSTRLNSSHANI